jgi:hypothetical protein
MTWTYMNISETSLSTCTEGHLHHRLTRCPIEFDVCRILRTGCDGSLLLYAAKPIVELRWRQILSTTVGRDRQATQFVMSQSFLPCRQLRRGQTWYHFAILEPGPIPEGRYSSPSTENPTPSQDFVTTGCGGRLHLKNTTE